MSPPGVFVTGTDTGVGKTVACAVLCRAWGADYWKPVQTGLIEDRGDTPTVAELAQLPQARLHPPRHAFAAPLSPHAAAQGVEIALNDFVLPDSPRPLVVEGAGGALVPLNGQDLTIDLIARLGLPTIVVAADRLGAINHALLTLEALHRRNLPVLGVILTGGPFADNAEAIARYGRTRILARLPWAEPLDADAVARWACELPDVALLGG